MKIIKALSSEKLGAVFYVTDTGKNYGISLEVRDQVGEAFAMLMITTKPEGFTSAPEDILDLFVADAEQAGDLISRDL